MLIQADARRIPLADGSVQCCVTSPPYWSLRSYGIGAENGELGLEPTPSAYVAHMVEVFREVKRVLRDDGVVFLNLGDSYQDKQLVGIPWKVAFALQDDGWILRSDIIWHKPNPMPESVTDRPTKSHEYLFLLSKSARYYYDADAVREKAIRKGGPPEAKRWRERDKSVPAGSTLDGKTAGTHPAGRNRRTVWTIPTRPYSGAHFATYPPALVEPCILAGTSAKGACPECGAPWERVVEKTSQLEPGRKVRGLGPKTEGIQDLSSTKLHEVQTVTTTGWRPTCSCGRDDVQPCLVLDPFAGSGTTGMVAIKHGREFVGLDLSGEYLSTLAIERLNKIQKVLL